MGTSTGSVSRVNLFDPIIKVNGVDIGFVGDKITLELIYTVAMFETGLPKNLKKVVKNTEKAAIKCDLMQTTLGNFQSALNLPASSLVSTSVITGGGDSNMNLLVNVEFNGTDDAGATLNVLFYKAAITENGSYSIDQEFVKIPVVFTAIAQMDRAKTDQLYRIARS